MPHTLKQWPRWAWLPPLAAVAIYGLSLACLSTASFPAPGATGQFWPHLSVQPVGEDAFYYLSTAWHLAAGDGLTAHGHTSVTGIQPLLPSLLTMPAAVTQWFGGGKWLFIRMVIVWMTVNVCLLGFLVARLTERIIDDSPLEDDWRISCVAFILTLGAFPLFRVVTYGLETGLYLALVVASMLASYRLRDGASDGAGISEDKASPVTTLIAVGLIFGVTGLARIDFGVVVGVFLLTGLIAGWFRVRDAIVSGATALAVVTPWLTYVYLQLGTLIPSSGLIQSNLYRTVGLHRRLEAMGAAIAEIVTPMWFLRLGGLTERIGYLVASVVAIAVVWLLRDRFGELVGGRLRAWLGGFVVLGLVYVVAFRSIWFYHRYISPLYLFVLPVVAVAIVHAIDHAPAACGQGRHRRWIAALTVFSTLQFFAWAFLVLHDDTAVQVQRLDAASNHAIGAGAIARHLPTDRGAIGAFQSGTIGYFHRDVVNLDGKVNNEVVPYLPDRDVCSYLQTTDVDYIVDWESIVAYHLADKCLHAEWQPCDVDMPEPFVCIVRHSG